MLCCLLLSSGPTFKLSQIKEEADSLFFFLFNLILNIPPIYFEITPVAFLETTLVAIF